MNILHLDFDDLESPYGGGQAVRNFEVNKRLVERGHTITVVTLDYQGAQNKMKNNIMYERSGWKKPFPFNLFSYFGSIPFIIKKHNFDLIIEDNIPPFHFGLSPLYSSKPVISQTQCFFDKTKIKKFYKIFKPIENFSIKQYSNFIVLTKTMARKIKKLNSHARIAVIPNGINYIHPFSSQHKNYLLFLGRIDFFQKGIDMLLESATLLQKNLPGVKIIMAGDGPDSSKLKKMIKHNRFQNIEFIGKVIGEEKEKLIRESAMLLLPSRFEIFPFTMLETASYGKPIISFSIENIEELMAQRIGTTVEPFNIKKYANTIVKLYNNKEECIRLGKNAHKWAQNHLWDTIVDTQEEFYFDCMERGRTKKEIV